MKKIILIVLFALVSFGTASCVEIDVQEEVESISYDFVVQNYYERGETVSIADETITVVLTDASELSLGLDDAGVSVSGDGINSDLTLYTDKVGMYTVYITYEDSMVELQYMVEDFDLLALINNQANYFEDGDRVKLKASFWIDNYNQLDDWNLGIYWQYIELHDPEADPETAGFYAETPYSPEGLNVRIDVGYTTIQNTSGEYLYYAKEVESFDDFSAPWDSSYEFVTYMKETITYRGLNKRANFAVAEVGFGVESVVDIDLLVEDMYKQFQSFTHKAYIDDVPIESHISNMDVLLYGGDLDYSIWGVSIVKEDFIGLNELTPSQLADYSTKLVEFANIRKGEPFSEPLGRFNSSFKSAFDGEGLYSYIWLAALYINGIDTTAIENAIDDDGVPGWPE